MGSTGVPSRLSPAIRCESDTELGADTVIQPVPVQGGDTVLARDRVPPSSMLDICLHTLQQLQLHLPNLIYILLFTDLILVALFYYLELLTSLRYFHKTGQCFVSCKSHHYPLPHGEFNTFKISHSSLGLISISDVFRKTRIT